jgi:ribonucleoside-diphosphate reductase alpha chain
MQQTANQTKNLGTIRSSNLCTEIMEFTKDEIAVCNLASLSLPMFVENGIQSRFVLYRNQACNAQLK